MADNVIGTGSVVIKPTLDKGAVSSVERSGGDAGRGFGGAFSVAAGNLIASAVSAIASAAVDVFANAFSNYADYEQLVGGVDTLFKESSEVVQKNAAEAYKTAGLSANEYMEQVTSFSASLLQGLDGDTAAAAAYADMAIRDMSDNANKMGTDMESITNAYQGFAKQNYTMLDNLKLGYGGTKSEMERLLADASEIAGVEFDIDNYNDVIEAIHVMQENMGIAGTTAQEATGTISGSISKLQSSWQNFLTGIFSDNADVGALGEQLFESIGDVLKNIVPRLGALVQNLFGRIPEALTNAMVAIPDVLNPVIDSVFGEGVGEQVFGIISDTVTNIQNVIQGATEVIQGMIETAWPAIEQYITIAMEGIDAFMQLVWPNIQNLITTVMDTISTVIQAVWPVIVNVWSIATNAIQAVASAVWPVISSIVQIAMNAITAAIDAIGPIVSFVSGVFDGILNAIKDPMETAKNIVESAISFIEGIFSGAHLELPHINLPHFNIYGGEAPWGIGGVGTPPKIDIEWYAKGGFVDGATLIGAGEAGPEMILPRQGGLMDEFASTVASKVSGISINGPVTVIADDPEDFIRQLTSFAARTRAQYA